MGDAPPRPSDDPAPEADRPRLPLVAAPTEEERRAAGEALEALAARIEASRGEAAVLSPRRQRLLLLSWLAEARSWQSDPRGVGVTPSVLAIVKRLRSLTESWWPGTVSAFQIHTTPASTRTRDLRGLTDEVPETWSDVARLASEALRKVDEEEAAAGCDAEGWADRAQAFPPPPDPESMLASLVAELEDAGGPLEGTQPKGGTTPPAADLERWARHLRWLRVPCSKDPRWGDAAGRLRFWTQRVSGFSTAAEYLDPAYRPPRSWATLIGANQQRAREALTLERVIESVPPATADDGALVAWLDRALPLTGSHQNTILQACAGLHDRILAIDEARLGESDRRIRRRLQKLKVAISTRDEEPAPPSNAVAPPEDPEVEAEEPEVLPDDLRALTQGKRALFVGNRTDGALQERLQAMLELERLEWAEATPRRVDAAVKAIGARAYDFVFAATGFMGHKYDARLARACRASGTPYLRVDRGRPGAVARALSRDLGGPIAAAN
ncbi:MAG TPA: hypothetical protein VN033_12410 [Vulgatibacter sp.]|nr:hypothetical protein [Vulgatibacter sp.]